MYTMEISVLLAACICLGLSIEIDYVSVRYGETHTVRIPYRAEYLYFGVYRSLSSQRSVLWTRSKPLETTRGQIEGRTFRMDKVTQADNGIYTFEMADEEEIKKYSIRVSNFEETYTMEGGDKLFFDFPLDPNVCLLDFTNSDGDEMNIYMNGMVTDYYFGPRLKFQDSTKSLFSVEIEDLQVGDSGVYQVRDRKGNLALEVYVTVTASSVWVNVGIAVGIVFAVLTCCCCTRRFCCKKSSKSSEPEPEQTESPSELRQHSVEPSLPRYSSEPRPNQAYGYQPAKPAPSVEMYSPASVPFTAPPAQSAAAEVYTAAAEVYPAAPEVYPPRQKSTPAPEASDFPSSDSEPRFEMKGFNMPPPLYSECASAAVYTSDKLHFKFL
ncbi:hypothetical protein NHX12_011908 [Muraenolepis orangiensis]|uniref:Immunoglobulin subtype domain-containing protein n=1 Tax=Muraenolepis orangiensis TaxID=630683 RepID=A0A9Q0DGS3_9TELE|nr:hypothetical protein NHX12_011908 [Muraenolepis orangiensis]